MAATLPVTSKDARKDPSLTGIPNEIREYVVPSFDEFWNSLQSPIADIRDRIALDPRRFQELVLTPIKFLAKGFFLNPASMDHHDAEPGGLVRHTLKVIINILDRVPATGPDKHGATDRVAAFVMAFLHDLGRSHDCRISDVATKQEYSVSRMDQVTWVETFGVKRYQIEWFRERLLSGEFSSEPIGYGWLSYFFSTGIVSFLGRRRMNSLLFAACRSIGKPRYDYYMVMKGADIQDAKLRAPHAIPLDDAFLPTLAVAIVSEATGFRTRTAWVGPTHTVVTLFDGHGHGLAWEEGVRAVSGHPAMSADRTVLDRLTELRPNMFAVWKRDPADVHYRYAVAVSVDSAPPLPAVIIANRKLWEDVPVESVRHLRVPRMFFGDPDACCKSVINPADVGFEPCPANRNADESFLSPAIQAGTIKLRDMEKQESAVTPLPAVHPPIAGRLVLPRKLNLPSSKGDLPPIVRASVPQNGYLVLPDDWASQKVTRQRGADFCERLICNILHMGIDPVLEKALTDMRGSGSEEDRNNAYQVVLRHLYYAIALAEQAHRGSTTPAEGT